MLFRPIQEVEEKCSVGTVTALHSFTCLSERCNGGVGGMKKSLNIANKAICGRGAQIIASGIAVFAWFLLLPTAQGSLAVAQAVGVGHAIVDEFGRPLNGTSPAAAAFGHAVVEGDLIHILRATDGKIYPPDADGTPDARNELLATVRIGQGVVPTSAKPARFGSTLTPRPGGNSKIFVRVFNAARTEEASFYGDSQLFTVKSWQNEVFLADISATDQPLDGGDEDGDGLSNSWEKSYGSDSAADDTDNDGLTDNQERMSGTDLLDAESYLSVADMRIQDGAIHLRWDGVEGLSYRVEASSDLGANGPFEAIGTVTGTGTTCEFVVPGDPANNAGTYRVCVVQ